MTQMRGVSMEDRRKATDQISPEGRRSANRYRVMLIPIAFLFIGAAGKNESADPGPDPTWEQAVPLAEAALRNKLIDPQSAQIAWPYNFVSGTLKPLIGKQRAGWYTCGWVNAKNRVGGYTGRVWFLVMINSGAVTELDIGSVDGIDPASVTCPNLVKKGMLSAAPAPFPSSTTANAVPAPVTGEAFLATAEQGARDAAARGGIGITYQVTPYGVFIAAVAPGSPAEKAGLKPGEVIESINGIATKSLEQPTVGMIFAGAGGELVLGIIGVGAVKVVR